jgi:hypothetical protein
MLQMKASNIVIINAQDVECCTTAEIQIVENRSFITYVFHAISLAFKNPAYVISAVIGLMNAISQNLHLN